MGKAEGELYHLTEAEVSKREEKIGSKRDFQIEEGRIRGIVWMLQLLHITLASLTPTPYSPKISGFRNSIRINNALNVSSHTFDIREQETHKQYIKYLMFLISIETI